MEINPPVPPFVQGGIHPLLTASIDDPNSGLTPLQRSIVSLLELYFCNKEIKSILQTVRTAAIHEAATNSLDTSSMMVDIVPCSDWMYGWIPVKLLLSFKSFKAIGATEQDLLSTIQLVCHAVFEISTDGSSIRRRVSFDQRSLAETVNAWTEYHDSKGGVRTTASTCTVEVLGFGDEMTQMEVKAYFEKFGTVKKMSIARDDEGERVILLQFEDPAVMVKVLASKHKYEDVDIRVRHYVPQKSSSSSSTTATATASTPSTQSLETTIDLSTSSQKPSSAGPVTITSISAKSSTVKPKGHHGAPASALLGYPVNRVLALKPVVDDDVNNNNNNSNSTDYDHLYPSAALNVRVIRAAFERLAPVAFVEWVPESRRGHVRFKQAVAKEVAKMIQRDYFGGGGGENGGGGEGEGFEVNGVRLQVECLEGEAERVFHLVQKEKEKEKNEAGGASSGGLSDAMIALNARKAVKSSSAAGKRIPGSLRRGGKRARQQQQQQQKKSTSLSGLSSGYPIYEQRSGSRKIVEEVMGTGTGTSRHDESVSPGKGKKRLLTADESMNDGEGVSGRKLLNVMHHQKKVKVDLVEEMLQSLNTM
ncbi:hypothetical protein HDV05_008604 [Chytridiales sp. JEL 0842]|nr:hypothetical protein HDV05_008604 [Chytridiales sp. JEL 0842]